MKKLITAGLVAMACQATIAETIRLEELDLTHIKNGWGTPRTNKSIQGKVISIGGKTFENGLGVHAKSKAVIDLDGKANRLLAKVGVDDEIEKGKATVEFIVKAGDKVLFSSGIMTSGDTAKSIDVDLQGVTQLTLEVTDGGDGNSYDHADWADTQIIYSGTKPAISNPNADYLPADIYPAAKDRKMSPGNTTYYLDPANGCNENSGLKKNTAWKNFSGINRIFFAPGDRIEILAPAEFTESLMPMGAGTIDKPVVISFAKGRYDLFPARAAKVKYHISNTNDDPYTPKAIGLYLKNAHHFKIEGNGAQLFFRGKMIETCIDGSEDIKISGLHFDYNRPTVSEFKVVSVTDKSAIIEIHKDSTYKIENGRIIWIGEGWHMNAGGYMQEHNPKIQQTKRCGNPIGGYKSEALEGRKVKLTFNHRHRLKVDHIYQNRSTYRDCVGMLQVHSKNIVWKDCGFHYLHGMGVISQFSENITFDSVQIAPRKESGRTCAAWADMLHFSGCKGKIVVKNVTFSGANDDAINVHGTHLRVMKTEEPHKVRVHFQHSQTYGFQPFFKNDSIEFISHITLTPYSFNKVIAVEKKNDKEFVLTLEKPAPNHIEQNDTIENATWTPDVEVRDCKIYNIPTRGFLFTTRGKIVVENNYFHRTPLSAILIEDDANSWFESGYVTNMLIKGNKFFECAPIHIDPKTKKNDPNKQVHSNIRVIGNEFISNEANIVSAKSVKGLTVSNNKVKIRRNEKPENAKKNFVHYKFCAEVKVENNTVESGYKGK